MNPYPRLVTICDNWIPTITCVGDAFYQCHLEMSEIIHHVFHQFRLSLPVNITCKSKLHIKGFPRLLEVNDWHRDHQVLDEEEESEIPEANDNYSIEYIYIND